MAVATDSDITGIGGGDTSTSPMAGTVEFLTSNVAATAYGNGVPYVPLAKAATEEYVQYNFKAGRTGTASVVVTYAMSASNGGDVTLRATQGAYAATEDQTAALATGQTFTITPGAGTATTSSTCALLLAVDALDYVVIRLTRRNVAGDTHTGTFNILDVSPSIA